MTVSAGDEQTYIIFNLLLFFSCFSTEDARVLQKKVWNRLFFHLIKVYL